MANIFNGADCGPSNALTSVMKHVEADRSLQRDRIGGPSSSKLHHLPSSMSGGPSAADQAMARQFFENAAGSSASPMPMAAPFPGAFSPPQMGASRSHTPMMAGPSPKSPEALEHLWSGRATPARAEAAGPSPWMAEFQTAGPSMANAPLSVQQASPSFAPYAGGAGMMYSAPQMFAPPLMQTPMFATAGQAPQHLDWDSEFQAVEAASKDKGKGRMVEVTDGDLESAFDQLNVESEVEKENPVGSLDDYMQSFEKVWEEVKAQNPGATDAELAKMEADYRQLLQQRDEVDEMDPDMLESMKEGWSNGYGLDLETDRDFGLNNIDGGSASTRYDDNGVPSLAPYAFEAGNPYMEAPTGALLARAKELLETNGSLDEAALLCEASIQKNEMGEGGYEAWLLLGRARSMDEREAQALRALRAATEIAQKAGNMEVGLLELAISYVNESFDLASHHCLRQWLYSKYKDMDLPQHPASHYSTAWSSHELTTDLFLQVARTLHGRGEMDADVQASLGVLFYSNGDYEKARDCFDNALQVRPNDYLLWNRLGSSLSNGSKPEEALGAYREALRLRPTYTRGIYNVGVACLNIGAYQEATEHFLHALTLRTTPVTSGGPGSPLPQDSEDQADQIWETLIRAFTMMNRPDLVNLAHKGDVNAFKPEFDF
ncbi:TPR-like protein [Clavulina sp. PMI_390]|nr:TPR-like protein [Clavulina sp. PMI_390]